MLGGHFSTITIGTGLALSGCDNMSTDLMFSVSNALIIASNCSGGERNPMCANRRNRSSELRLIRKVVYFVSMYILYTHCTEMQ